MLKTNRLFFSDLSTRPNYSSTYSFSLRIQQYL